MQRICVFAASSERIDKAYADEARALGTLLAQSKITTVYGGGNNGLMGVLAEAARQAGGKVVGIIPEMLHLKGYSDGNLHELVVTPDMRARKTEMEQRSDAFIALPGGFGTLEELLEILTLKQLHYHNKPIVIINTLGFYNTLIQLFEELYQKNFAREKMRSLYQVVPNATEAVQYLCRHRT